MKPKWWLSGAVLVSSVLLGETVAFSQNIPDSTLNSLPVNAPYCFMVSADGQLVNLERLCGENATGGSGNTASQRAVSATTNSFVPYADNSAGDLGGLNTDRSTSATPCYGLDAQGRPCS
jgi:hypothetical protein